MALLRPKFQSFAEVANRFLDISARREKGAEIAVSHPATRIPRNCRAPERLEVPVIAALMPAQCAENQQQCPGNCPPQNGYRRCNGFQPNCQDGGKQGERTAAGEILEVIGSQRVDDWVDGDKPEFA